MNTVTRDAGLRRYIQIKTAVSYRALLLFTIVFSLIICIWGIWSVPLLTHNEGRRAVVVREMLANRQWLIPTLNGQIYLAKPPLFYWAAGAFGLLFQSTAEWVIRLPSSLSALGTLWLLYRHMKRLLGDWPALLSAMTLLAAAKFTMHARLAEIEMLLTFCCTAAMLFFLDYLKQPDSYKPLYYSYAFLGLAFLTKGPVALVFFLPPLLLFWRLTKDRNIPAGLLSFRGWLIFAIPALPWYAYCLFFLSGNPMTPVIHDDILIKTFWSTKRDPFYSYVVVLAASFAPFLLLFLHEPGRRLKTLFSQYETAFFGCWVLSSLFVMSTFNIKHDKYLLPLFPGAAAFFGAWLAAVLPSLQAGGRFNARTRVLPAIMVLVAFWAVYHTCIVPYYKRQYWTTIETVLKTARKIKGKTPLFTYKTSYPTLVYYNGDIIPVTDKDDLQKMLHDDQPFLLIADNGNWDDLENEPLCHLREYKKFLNRKRIARLLGNGELCKDDKNLPRLSKEKTPVLQPDWP
jgi:4-amino-4-deoxy-L-arabinose transferase-like glycosyltransferase